MSQRARPSAVRTGAAFAAAGLAACVLPSALAHAGTRAPAATTELPAATTKLPAVTHVWNIVLENEDYATTFGNPSADPYLASTLPSQGVLLEDYYGIGHHSNDNYLALVAGQPPNPDTQNDCTTYATFSKGAKDVKGIESGTGCIYPKAISTIGNQLTAKKKTWKAYEEDMGNDPSREAAACAHPTVNGADGTEAAVSGDGYATKHNPFVYFDSVITDQAYCNADDVALGSPTGAMPPSALPGETGLFTDLQSASTTPTYSLITPNLCNDGHDYPCKNESSGASALADIDTFLQTWVPMIEASPAYKSGGLIEVTFDESDGPSSDSTACCGETPGPAAAEPGIDGPGGGLVGAVLISPFVKAGTVSTVPYNHFSTLGTDEKLFGLSPLGEARTVTATFGPDVFSAP